MSEVTKLYTTRLQKFKNSKIFEFAAKAQLIFRWNLLEAGFFLRELMTKVFVSSMDGEHW